MSISELYMGILEPTTVSSSDGGCGRHGASGSPSIGTRDHQAERKAAAARWSLRASLSAAAASRHATVYFAR
jgi:hypothetical protein